MLYWKQILEYVIVLVNLVYLSSLVVTYLYYPAGPVYDLETDAVIGQTYGLTKWHIFMLVPFNLINRWCYTQINNQNELGVRPAMAIDLFGLNTLVIIVYSYTNKGLHLYWVAPLYGGYKVFMLVKGFCCAGRGLSVPEEEESKSNRQLKKEKGEMKPKVKYMKA